jgi:photosystem II stability/assembly factor-like uncharacterized protein
MNRLISAFGAAFVLGVAPGAPSAASELTAPLSELSHIHGVEFEASGDAILFATHYGIFRFSPGAPAVLISPDQSDYMGFTMLSNGNLIASGHPENGGNLGVIESTNSGSLWTKVSDGADGPVDFHAIASPADVPDFLYGLYRGAIQVSTDGGRSWAWSGKAPPETLDLAASTDNQRLFAATSAGILISSDKGASWALLTDDALGPTSLVAVLGSQLYAYVIGHGLMRRSAIGDDWLVLAPDMGDIVPLHLAQDPKDKQRFVMVAQGSAVLESKNGGSSWSPLE